MPHNLTIGAQAASQSRNPHYDILVESTTLDIHYSIDFEGPEHAGKWEHRFLAGQPSVAVIDHTLQRPRGGGIVTFQSMQLTLLEDDQGRSLRSRYNDIGQLEGADIMLSVLFDGEAYDDKVQLFPLGRITRVQWGIDTVTLIAVDQSIQENVDLPRELLPQDFPDTARVFIGQALPILYGDGGDVGNAPLFLVDKSGREYRCAHHGVRSVGTLYGIYRSLSGVAKTRTGDATLDAGAANLVLTSPLTELRFGSETATLSVQEQSDVTSASNAIDGSSATQAIVSTDSFTDGFGSGYGYLGIKGAFSEPEGLDRARVEIQLSRVDAATLASMRGRLILRSIDGDGNVVRDLLWISEEIKGLEDLRDYTFEIPYVYLESDYSLELLIEAIFDGGTGSSGDRFIIGEVVLMMEAAPEGDEDPLFLVDEWEGRPDDSSGTFTGTADALIELPGDVIYSIFSEELSLTVDTSYISAARTSLSSWKFAFGVGGQWYHSRISARELLNSLAKQCKSTLFFSEDGWVLIPYDSSTASTYSFTDSDILFPKGTNPLSTAEARPQINVQPGDIADVYNHVEIRYGYDPATLQFAKLRYAHSGGTNSGQSDAGELVVLCQNSENRYGRRQTLSFPAFAIYDDTTAELLLDHLVRYFWTQRINVRFETGWQALGILPGFFWDITSATIPLLLRGQTFETHGVQYYPFDGRIGLEGSRKADVKFDYIELIDQDSNVWYWWIRLGQEIYVSDTAPTQAELIDNQLLSGALISWLEIAADDDGTPMYVWPDTTDGAPNVDTSPPASGSGTDAGDGLGMRAIDGLQRKLVTYSWLDVGVT